MYVNWYPEAHIEIKNVQLTKDIIIVDKSELPKMFEYSDEYGYTGNLYLDAASYEVTKTKDETVTEILDREVFVHELNFHQIFGNYINPASLDSWMEPPTSTTSTMWPKSITVDFMNLIVLVDIIPFRIISTQWRIHMMKQWELVFDKLEYEQVYAGDPVNGEIQDYSISQALKVTHISMKVQ